MKQKKITVVVPVYNGEKYITACVDSILNQQDFDLNDLEILLLNDGSKDSSLKLIKKYQRAHPGLIAAIDQKNMGAANTRNKGIRLATGTYLMLVDQDDYIDSDYCRTFYDAIEKSKSDLVQGGFKLVNKQGETIKEMLPTETEFGKFLAIPAWAKLYRTAFLRDNSIEFFANNIGEDSIFTSDVIMKAANYATISYAGYCNSFDNDTNVTNTLHKGLSKSVNIIGLLERLQHITASDEAKEAMLRYNVIRTATYYLLSYGRYATRARFYDTYKEIFGWFDREAPDIYKNRYLWRRPAGEYVSAHIGIKGLVILHKLRLVRLFAIMYCKKGDS